MVKCIIYTDIKLTEEDQEIVGANLGINNTDLDKVPTNMSTVEKGLHDIGIIQKHLTHNIFRTQSLQEKIPFHDNEKSPNYRNKCLSDSEEIMQKFNSYASNICVLNVKNRDIEKEIDRKDSSPYFPQDSSEVVQTDFTSYEPFDE